MAVVLLAAGSGGDDEEAGTSAGAGVSLLTDACSVITAAEQARERL